MTGSRPCSASCGRSMPASKHLPAADIAEHDVPRLTAGLPVRAWRSSMTRPARRPSSGSGWSTDRSSPSGRSMAAGSRPTRSRRPLGRGRSRRDDPRAGRDRREAPADGLVEGLAQLRPRHGRLFVVVGVFDGAPSAACVPPPPARRGSGTARRPSGGHHVRRPPRRDPRWVRSAAADRSAGARHPARPSGHRRHGRPALRPGAPRDALRRVRRDAHRPRRARRLPHDARTPRSGTSGVARRTRWRPSARPPIRPGTWRSSRRSSSAVPRSARATSGPRSPWRSPGAATLLGRAHAIVGDVEPERDGTSLTFPMPVALPPDGDYAVRVGSPLGDGSPSRGRSTVGTVEGATVRVTGRVRSRRVRVAFVGAAVGG